MAEVMKWKDGADVICDKCGQPIYSGQPVQATISHAQKKRHAHHFFCGGGTMTIIGSPSPGVTEITQYGGGKPEANCTVE